MALLGLALVSSGRIGSAVSGARGEAVLSRVASLSGLEYAAARLREDDGKGLPVPTAANAGDDRTCRDPSAFLAATPATLANPSYAHGDRWTDDASHATDGADNDADGIADEPGEGTGLWTAGDILSGDRDGDGRFDAASGRLRAGTAGRDLLFSLRIAASSALACVNSGELGAPDGDHDLDGLLNRDDPDYGTDLDGALFDADADGIPDIADGVAGPFGNGVPDWRDPDFEGNVHIVNLLDNLGAVLGLPAAPRLYAPAEPAADPVNAACPMAIPDIGRRIVSGRPRGGYTAISQIRPFLSAAEFAAVAPYLALSGEIVPVGCPGQTSRLNAYRNLLAAPETRWEFHARIDFNEAPLRILMASLRYLSASGTFYQTNMGAMFGATPVGPGNPFVRLLPGEADRIARRLAAARPLHDARGLLAALVAVPDGDLEDDPFTADNDAVAPRRHFKEDLVLAQACADGYFYDTLSVAACSLEVPRPGWPAGKPRGIMKAFLSGPLSSSPYRRDGTFPALVTSDMINGIPCRQTAEWNLAARPDRFSVECAGWQGSPAGEAASARSLHAGEIALPCRPFLATGQQDFEPVSTPLRPVSASSPWRLAGGDLSYDLSHLPARAGTQSGPRAPLLSGSTGAPNCTAACTHGGMPPVPPELEAQFRHCRALGNLRLSARQWDDRQLLDLAPGNAAMSAPVVYAAPFNEDRTASPVNLYDPNGWIDNLADPIAGTGPGGKRSPDPVADTTSAPWRYFFCGVQSGPAGLRAAAPNQPWVNPAPAVFRTAWNPGSGGFPFPLPRADHAAPFGTQDGEIVEGTIAFTAPARGGENHGHNRVRGDINLWISYTSPAGLVQRRSYVRIQVADDGSLLVKTNTLPFVAIAPPPGFPAGAAWHHYAISFEDHGAPGDGQGTAHVFYDGIESPTTASSPFILTMPSPSSAVMTMDWHTAPFDDLVFYRDSLHLAPEKIRFAAAQSCFDPAGTFRTTRFAFDPERFPDGAVLAGAAWETLIPAETGGRFTFDVKAYDAPSGGTLLNPGTSDPGRGLVWDGSSAGAPMRAFRTPRCRSFEIEIRIDTDAQLLLDNGSGGTAKSLRDSPVLEEFRVFYGDPKGRAWTTGIEER